MMSGKVLQDGETLSVDLFTGTGRTEKEVIIDYLKQVRENPLTWDDLESLSENERATIKKNAEALIESLNNTARTGD